MISRPNFFPVFFCPDHNTYLILFIIYPNKTGLPFHMVIEYREEYGVCPCSSLRKKETCDIMEVKLPYFELPVQGRGYIAESQIEYTIHAFLKKGERS